MLVLQTGDRIGEWIVQTRIGEGAMGEVWLAQNAITSRLHAAVKVLKPTGMDMSRQRFVREIESLARLQHPAIVRVLGWGDDTERDLLWLAMERLQGKTLADRLVGGSRMTADEALTVFGHLAGALRHAHQQGIAHRDIKPANLMLCDDGLPRIVDFGIAMADGATRYTAAGSVTGTGGYLPPEAFEEEEYDFKSGDIYALGVVLYEALEGRNAFRMNMDLPPQQRVLDMLERKRHVLTLPNAVPEAVRSLVTAASHPDPNKRLRTASDLVAGIEQAKGGRVLASPVHTAAPAASRQGVSIVATIAVALVAVAGIALVGGALLMLVGVVDWSAVSGGSDDPVAERPAVPKPQQAERPRAQPRPALEARGAEPEPAAPEPEPEPERGGAPEQREAHGTGAGTTMGQVPMDIDVDPNALIALSFESDLPDTAVAIDGAPIGTAPIRGRGVTAGKHTLTMTSGATAVSTEIKVNRRGPIRYILRGGQIQGFK